MSSNARLFHYRAHPVRDMIWKMRNRMSGLKRTHYACQWNWQQWTQSSGWDRACSIY